VNLDQWVYLFQLFRRRDAQRVALTLDIEQTMDFVPTKRMSHRILKEGDILNIVMEYLDAQSLASLHEVLQPNPPKWISRYDSFQLTLQRVIQAILPFFPDPHAFADCMCKTGAIIGGSTALAVFNGEKWSPGDLDIVVSTTFAPLLIEFIMKHGYNLENEAENFYEGHDDVQAFSWSCYRKGGVKIDISTTRKYTPAQFIGTYHHSFVMNFISHDGLYSFFPHDTSARRGRVNGFEKPHKAAAARAKYLERGYIVIDDHPIQDITGDPGHVKIQSLKDLWFQKLPLTTYEHQRLCWERNARDKALQRLVSYLSHLSHVYLTLDANTSSEESNSGSPPFCACSLQRIVERRGFTSRNAHRLTGVRISWRHPHGEVSISQLKGDEVERC